MTLGNDLAGVGVVQLTEVKLAALSDAEALSNPLRVLGEALGHLSTRLKVAFPIGLEEAPRLVEGAVVANALQDILERLASGTVLKCPCGGHYGQVEVSCRLLNKVEALAICAQECTAGHEVDGTWVAVE